MNRMPIDRVEKTIAGMMPGETLWTVPWAVIVAEDRSCSINGHYTVHERRRGTANMLIHRNAEGFEIDLSYSDHSFSPGAAHFGASRLDYLPVTKIIGA